MTLPNGLEVQSWKISLLLTQLELTPKARASHVLKDLVHEVLVSLVKFCDHKHYVMLSKASVKATHEKIVQEGSIKNHNIL